MIADVLALVLTTLLLAPGMGDASDGNTATKKVLVLSSPSVPDTAGFVAALRIQLGQRTAVETGPAVTGTTPATRAENALRAAAARGASAAIWVVHRPRTRRRAARFVAHLAHRRNGRVQSARFPMTGRTGPDTDRALALKVSDALDGDHHGWRKTVQDGVAVDDTDPAGATAPPPRSRHTWLELGGTMSAGDGSPAGQFGVTIALGAARTGSTETGAYVMAQADAGVSSASPAGDVSTRELAGDVGIQVLRRRGHLAVGGDLRIGARYVRATGTTPGEAMGTTWVVIPRAVASVDGRVRMTNRLELRAAAGIELVSRRRRFAVNDEVLVDAGRGRLTLLISAVFSSN